MIKKLLFETMRPIYMVFVDPVANKNKFYRMIPDSDGNGFSVEYGRIGAPTIRTDYYDSSEFDKLYRSKIKKGYRDQTHLAKTALQSTTGEDGFKAIQDVDVKQLINSLRQYSSDTIKANYSISQGAVTQQMLDKADELIAELHNIASDNQLSPKYISFNRIIIDLFNTIPRKMKHVQNYIARVDNEIPSIIQREEDLLNIMKTNYQTSQVSSNTQNTNTQTILESLGLECQLVTDQTKINQITSHLGQVAPKFKRAFKIVNKKTNDKYIAWAKANNIQKNQLFFHGSKNENFWSILKNGMNLNPKAKVTGKMLGYGIYFAEKAVKSLNYTSLRGAYWAHGNSSVGYLAVFSLAIDSARAYNVTTSSEISSCSNMTYNKLQKVKPGSTHVYAHKGSYLREDEIVIYNEDQCTIRYLIELKA